MLRELVQYSEFQKTVFADKPELMYGVGNFRNTIPSLAVKNAEYVL